MTVVRVTGMVPDNELLLRRLFQRTKTNMVMCAYVMLDINLQSMKYAVNLSFQDDNDVFALKNFDHPSISI